MYTEIKDMLESIMKDGVTYMPARDVLVKHDGDGFTVYVDGEEYGYYPKIRELIKDIQELQNDRPFTKEVVI
jgi:hypothetical protein